MALVVEDNKEKIKVLIPQVVQELLVKDMLEEILLKTI
jgi:hypothetical protein